MFSRKTVLALFAMLAILFAVAAGCGAEPQVIEKEVIRTVIVEKAVEVEKVVKETVVVEKAVIVEKEVEVEVEVEVEKIVKQTVVVEKEVEVEVEVEKIVEKIVEVVGAIPYSEGVPMAGGPVAKRFNLEEIYVYKALPEYSQSPTLDALVADGTLPPVEERLPKEPWVFLEGAMSTGLGEYGGVWRDFSACPSEGWNLGAGQTQGWFGINIIYQEGLLKTGPLFMRGDKIEPMPNLAKSFEWSSDGYELTMHLIEGASWSDGEPFSADDVMFTWEHLILDPNVNHNTSRTTWQIGGEDVDLEKVDDYTIKWTFPVPNPVQLLFKMDDYDFAVWPEHAWAQYHPAFSDNDYVAFEKSWPMEKLPPVTMGPWVATEYKTDQIMVHRRNPYYWKVDEAGKQLPYLDEVVFEKGATGVGRTLSTLAGSADHTNLENPSTFIETLKRAQEADAHFYVEWGPELLAFSLHMNQSDSLGVEDERDAALRELFRDVRFRRAVSQAIDRDGVSQAVVRGPFLRAWPGGLYPGSGYFDRDSVVYYPYSPDTARKLLAELGLEDTDGNGTLNWTEGPMAGQDLVIELLAGEAAEASGNIAEALVPLMAEVGIQVNYRPVKGTTMTDYVIAGTWEWYMSRGGQAYAVPFTRAQDLGPVTKEQPSWHREGDEPRQLQPFEERIVEIINEFALEPDAAKRFELMSEYNRLFTENVYDVGIVIGRYGLALAERFKNVPVACPTFLYQWTWGNCNPDQVWVAPEEQLAQIQPGVVPTYE